ncbi:MAG: sugar ABC transporter permease [Clostridia bacterium]|nr:sugar ABC transporter permease [Clostridia bacterium]
MSANNAAAAALSGNRIHVKKGFWRANGKGYLFLLPFLLLFALFIIVPVIVAAWTSLTNNNMLQPAHFVGLNNYRQLFLNDDIFLVALQNTFVFAFITGPIGYFLSFVAAWVINSLKAKNAFALAFYAPSITSGVAMSVVWGVFFSPDRYGYLNNFLINLGFISSPVLWTMDARYIMFVVMFVSIWMSMGAGFLVFLAGLQNIPRDYYEAASIDGLKSRLQELFYITLPTMKPQLLFGAVNAIVTSFGVFDIAVALVGFPSPNYAAHTIVAHLYDYAFIRFQMGYASAIAMVLFVITFFLGRIVMKVLSEKD